MKVYKVDRFLIWASGLLVLTSAVFSYSFILRENNPGVYIFAGMMFFGILYYFVTLYFRKIETYDGNLKLYTIYGRKTIKFDEVEEINIVKLKMRVMIIMSDPKKFVFLSSYYEQFDELMMKLKEKLGSPFDEVFDTVNLNSVHRRQLLLKALVTALNLFFIGSSIYNFLY